MSAPEVVVHRGPNREVVIEQGGFGSRPARALVLMILGAMLAISVPALLAALPLEMAVIAVAVLVIGEIALVALVARLIFGRFRIELTPGRLRVTTGPMPTRTVELDPATIRILRFGRAIKVHVLTQMTDRVPIEALDEGGASRVLVHCYGHHRSRSVVDELTRALAEDGHRVTEAGHP
jgi:hypothetical protein